MQVKTKKRTITELHGGSPSSKISYNDTPDNKTRTKIKPKDMLSEIPDLSQVEKVVDSI